jgi:hypothetical protein
MLGQSQSSGEIDGGGGLTHAALLVDYRERLGYLISPLNVPRPTHLHI